MFYPHVVQIDPEMKCLKTKEAQQQILSTGLFRVMIRLHAGTWVLLAREDVIEMFFPLGNYLISGTLIKIAEH